MFKGLTFVFVLFFNASSFANVDIDLACDEQKEQKRSLLTRLSTSVTEAHLAGQCTGYYLSYMRDNEWKESCSEFLEQKKSLLGSLSTSLKEAHLAGMCVGAIYRVAKRCKANTYNINYSYIVEGEITREVIKQRLGCYGNEYGQ